MAYEAPKYISPPKDRDSLKRALDRLQLCSFTIQEAHYEIEAPANPEHKADLLLAAENLAYEAVDLLNTVKLYVWGPEPEEDPEDD
jgi:hypothetical protein